MGTWAPGFRGERVKRKSYLSRFWVLPDLHRKQGCRRRRHLSWRVRREEGEENSRMQEQRGQLDSWRTRMDKAVPENISENWREAETSLKEI